MPMATVSVLLVEDDSSIAELYALKLRMDGYVVHHASDGTTAQIIFETTAPQVVCCDSRLPDGSGIETARGLAERHALVILLTNDQRSYESPPAGVARALLKSRTSPALLSATIADLLVGAPKTRR